MTEQTGEQLLTAYEQQIAVLRGTYLKTVGTQLPDWMEKTLTSFRALLAAHEAEHQAAVALINNPISPYCWNNFKESVAAVKAAKEKERG